MSRSVVRGVTIAMAMAGVAFSPTRGAAQDFTWRGRLDAGATLEVKGVNGDIQAVAAEGDEVVVDAVKHGRRSDPDQVEIVVVEHGGGVTICAVYPTHPGDRPNECAPGGGGRLNARENDVRVDFTVRVPAGVRLAARTVNGEIEATRLGGDVVATTVNGDVEVSTTGLVEAQTVNGSIDASLARADWTDELEFKTVNGSITVALPADVDADVHASTVNGDITTDFPLRVEGRVTNRRLRGRIGNGGRELTLGTVNGSIRIRKST
ncbi:MAG TPA: DUF4097 family beta strand repeat-containing protein [Longimicrobiales bacterium]